MSFSLKMQSLLPSIRQKDGLTDSGLETSPRVAGPTAKSDFAGADPRHSQGDLENFINPQFLNIPVACHRNEARKDHTSFWCPVLNNDKDMASLS